MVGGEHGEAVDPAAGRLGAAATRPCTPPPRSPASHTPPVLHLPLSLSADEAKNGGESSLVGDGGGRKKRGRANFDLTQVTMYVRFLSFIESHL